MPILSARPNSSCRSASVAPNESVSTRADPRPQRIRQVAVRFGCDARSTPSVRESGSVIFRRREMLLQEAFDLVELFIEFLSTEVRAAGVFTERCSGCVFTYVREPLGETQWTCPEP